MRPSHLESALSSLQREFPDPKVELEQYPTSPHLTASVICMACDRGDITEKSIVLDLGCGTGLLALGSAFVANTVIGIDCDEQALEVAIQNAESVDLSESVHFIHSRVHMVGVPSEDPKKQSGADGRKSNNANNNRAGKKGRGRGRGRGGGTGSAAPRVFPSPLTLQDDNNSETSPSSAATIPDSTFPQSGPPNDGLPLRSGSVDVVLTNPPFGTKADNAGMDVQFLWSALRVARTAVYSFHKRSTRAYLLRTLTRDWGYEDAAVVAEMSFDVPQMYKFHKQKSVDIEVDLIRVGIPRGNDGNTRDDCEGGNHELDDEEEDDEDEEM